MPLREGDVQAVEHHSETKEEKRGIVADVDGDFEQLAQGRRSDWRVPAQETAAVQKDAVDLERKSVEGVAKVVRLKKDDSEKGYHRDMMNENGDHRRARIVQAIEKVPAEITDTESDERIVEEVRVRHGIVEHFWRTKHGDDDSQ